MRPVSCPISQGYGVNCGYYKQFNLKLRNGSSCHEGIDYACPAGTPVKAAHAGTVRYRGVLGNYGNYIGLQADNGSGTGYAHLQGFNVSNGQRVAEGQVIGYVGSSGNSSGPHLHFNYYRQYGVWVYDNPDELLASSMPYSDEQYNALKADRDRYAEDWANEKYWHMRGKLPTRDERRSRLSLPWAKAVSAINNSTEWKKNVIEDPWWLKATDSQLKARLDKAKALGKQITEI